MKSTLNMLAGRTVGKSLTAVGVIVAAGASIAIAADRGPDSNCSTGSRISNVSYQDPVDSRTDDARMTDVRRSDIPCRTAVRDPSWSETRWADDVSTFASIYTGQNYPANTFKTRMVSPSVECDSVAGGAWSDSERTPCGCGSKNAQQRTSNGYDAQAGACTHSDMNKNAEGRTWMNGASSTSSNSNTMESTSYKTGKYGDARDKYHEVTLAEMPAQQSQGREPQTASRNPGQ